MQKVSVVIVVYNGAASIRESISSVLNQTYPCGELVIIDGGSNDGTQAIIEEFGTGVAYWVSEQDKGIYDAMNKGIKAARGKWILFLGADDVLVNEKVLADIFSSQDYLENAMIYGDVLLRSSGKIQGGSRNYLQLVEANICHQAIFYNAAVFTTVGMYSLQYPILADYEMNLRIFRDQHLKKKYLPYTVTLFNDRGTSNVSIDRHFHEDMFNIFIREGMPWNSRELQQYHFYSGAVGLLSGKFFRPACKIFFSVIRGRRKFFYFLLTGRIVFNRFFARKIRVI